MSLVSLWFDIEEKPKTLLVYQALNSGKLCSFMIKVLLPTIIQYLFMCNNIENYMKTNHINDKNEND